MTQRKRWDKQTDPEQSTKGKEERKWLDQRRRGTEDAAPRFFWGQATTLLSIVLPPQAKSCICAEATTGSTVKRLVAAGYWIAASVSPPRHQKDRARPRSTFINPDTTPREQQKCQGQREDGVSSFEESQSTNESCPAAFMTLLFTRLQAGWWRETNTETYWDPQPGLIWWW